MIKCKHLFHVYYLEINRITYLNISLNPIYAIYGRFKFILVVKVEFAMFSDSFLNFKIFFSKLLLRASVTFELICIPSSDIGLRILAI